MYNKDNKTVIIGRVFDISDKTVTVFDGHNELKKFVLPVMPDFRCGDIVVVRLTHSAVNGGKSSADEIRNPEECKVVTRCTDNPFDNPHSLPSRCLNESLDQVLMQRNKFLSVVASFFDGRHYMRMESPVLVDSPGVETYLEPFATDYYDYNAIAHRMYLPTSPEYALKAAVGAFYTDVYSFARSFRNCGEESLLHKKEFTMLEWYIALHDYHYIMEETQRLLAHIGECYQQDYALHRDGQICDLHNCDMLTMRELFARHGIELNDYTDDADRFISSVRHYYEGKGESLSNNLNKDDYFFKFFMDYIEPTLGFDRPAIVRDFPIEMCPLSLPVTDDNRYGQRFEVYIFGIELANGYTELTDYEQQRKNFEAVLAERQQTGETEHLELPDEFLQTLRYGVPPCTGCALGLDRMFMLCEEFDDIHKTDWY